MSELPHGTVTFLFTDVEGSTQLQRLLGARYHEVVEVHRRLLEEAFAAHGGIVVDRQTESFFVAFRRARDAVAAAADAQQALGAQSWPDEARVTVRMGIHAGEPEVAGDRYVGLAVSRAARICALGHGGQVLLSSAARALLGDDERAALRSLGRYWLKDFSAAEPISQLVVEGLPTRFPPLRAKGRPSTRKRLLVGTGAIGLVGAIAAALLVLTLGRGGSSGLSGVGPDSIGVIDAKSSKLVGEVPVGFKSSLIAAGEAFVWVADPKGSTLVKIDPRTREVVSRIGISVGAGSVPFGLAAGAGAVWLAVLRGSTQAVLELGPVVGELRRTISFGQKGHPVLFRGNPLTLGGGAVWALDVEAGGLWRIEPRSGKARKLIDGLNGVSLAADDEAVWVAGPSTVVKIDAATGLELASISVGSQPLSEASAIALGAGAVWFVSSSGRALWEIDPAANATTRTFSVGRGPSGLAVGEGAVWAGSSRDGTVTRVDPRSGATKTIGLGLSVGGVVARYGAVWTSPGEPRG